MMVKPFLLLFLMIFLHVVGDYYLQGILAQMKQKRWWTDTVTLDKKYENDYIAALIAHAFSWSFVVSSPLLILSILQNNETFMAYVAISYIWLTAVHAFTDHLKANVRRINLVEDQVAHLIQIFALWVVALHYILS